MADVSETMADLNVGAILVLEHNRLCGLFSERDLLKRVVVSGLNPEYTRVEEVMSTSLATIEEGATVEAAMELMHEHKCRHLPVMRGPRV